MKQDVKFAKLISGDTVIGVYNGDEKKIQDVALVQAVPSQSGSGVQIMILPFGFPYENEIIGEIAEDKILYEYKKLPDELKSKYLQEKSNIKISSSMSDIAGEFGNNSSGSGLII